MADVTISIRDNGPYRLRGSFRIVDAEGNEFELEETTALCRCGHSGRKPFCDGSHRQHGFQSSPRA